MDTIDVLRKARALLVGRGWCQGFWCLPDGRMCAHKALCEVSSQVAPYGDAVTFRAWWAVWNALPMRAARSLPRFNDLIAKNVDDVLAVFDRAIAALEAA